METLKTEVLVVGGGTGGTAAAIQAARRGAKTLLVSEFPWLGGMLTSAGVSAPDGNELLAFQTGIWGAFLRSLHHHYPQGLDHAWVSFFTYEPAVGAGIFAEWVRQVPNLQWRVGGVPLGVERIGDRITAVCFAELRVEAQIILDGTELGDLLELGQVPYRWGWEAQELWDEPSAPPQFELENDPFYRRYPVQAPTWVVVLRDFLPGSDPELKPDSSQESQKSGQGSPLYPGSSAIAPDISPPPAWSATPFVGAWQAYGTAQFLDYGRLPGHLFMINWPIRGNDYGEGIDRLIQTPQDRHAFLQDCLWHSQGFAHFIQSQLGRRYGLATETFPLGWGLGGGAYALHPYYRESRRLQGMVTVTERDILPIAGGQVAPLPLDQQGRVSAIALGNYANDHHYPDRAYPLQTKSLRWGGRWTGTAFALPYGCLVPADVDGLLVCEKNISVSHIANGATRLQPVVLGLGQAAGMAAALCVEQGCQPRDLAIDTLQQALLHDPLAPAALIPCFDLLPEDPQWLSRQLHYLQYPHTYPASGEQDSPSEPASRHPMGLSEVHLPEEIVDPVQNPADVWIATQVFNTCLEGQFHRLGDQDYCLAVQARSWQLVTLSPLVNRQLQACTEGQWLRFKGQINRAGGWFRVDRLEHLD